MWEITNDYDIGISCKDVLLFSHHKSHMVFRFWEILAFTINICEGVGRGRVDMKRDAKNPIWTFSEYQIIKLT